MGKKVGKEKSATQFIFLCFEEHTAGFLNSKAIN